MSNTEVEALN